MPEFTLSELEELAEIICGRYDSLKEIRDGMSPNMPASSKRAINNDILTLQSMDEKLRPYYKETK